LPARTRWILWLAFLQTLLLLAGLGFFIRPEQTDGADNELLGPILAAAAVLPGLLSVVAGRFALRDLPSATAYLVRLVAGEAVGLLGFVVLYVHASDLIGGSLMLAGLGLHLLNGPLSGADRDVHTF
jgi:hypothetical protein